MLLRTTSQTSALDAVISDIPWGDAFGLGKGVDAVTGSLMPSAIVDSVPTPQTMKMSTQQIRLVQTEDDLNREISTSVSGKYNIEGLTVGGSAQYIQQLQVSDLSLSLIASYNSQYQGYDELTNPQLTPQAQKLDPTLFRKTYGDYFIKGAQRGANFVAVYTCRTRTTKDLTDFSAKISADSPDVMSAEGKVAFMQSAQQHDVDIAVTVFMEGYNSGKDDEPNPPWTPDKVLTALQWFKQHETGVYTRAELMHYNALNPNLPRTVDVPPDVFVALRGLYETVWDVRALYASCPNTYQPRFQTAYRDLDAGVVARKEELASNAALCAEYQKQADALQRQLRQVSDRMAFYFRVSNAVSTEPKRGQEIDADGRSSYLYGYKAYSGTIGPLPILVNTQTYAQEYQGPGWLQDVLQFQDSTRLIVGWEVVSNWATWLNGQWKKNNEQILLTSGAQVWVCSCYDRGTTWTLNVYSVPEADYRFQS